MSRSDLVLVLVVGCIIASLIMVDLGNKHSEQVFVNSQLRTTISGQQATIASYKENLTSCLKEAKMATQDEFTGE